MVNKPTSRYLVCQVVIRTVEEKAAGLGPGGYRVSAGVVVSYEVGRKGFPRRTHVSRDLGGERVQPSRDLGKSVPRGGTSSGKSTEVSVLRVGEKQGAAGVAECTEGAGSGAWEPRQWWRRSHPASSGWCTPSRDSIWTTETHVPSFCRKIG